MKILLNILAECYRHCCKSNEINKPGAIESQSQSTTPSPSPTQSSTGSLPLMFLNSQRKYDEYSFEDEDESLYGAVRFDDSNTLGWYDNSEDKLYLTTGYYSSRMMTSEPFCASTIVSYHVNHCADFSNLYGYKTIKPQGEVVHNV